MPDIHLPSGRRGLVLRRWFPASAFVLLVFSPWMLAAQWANFDDLLRQIPPLQRHADVNVQQLSGELYEHFAKERAEGRWFAVLLPHSNPPSYSILRRFESWNRFMDFLQQHDAIV